MRKIILCIVVLTISIVSVGCGPNYTEEFNAAVDLYNDTFDAREEAWGKADLVMQETNEIDEIVSAYEDMILANNEALSVVEPLLVEVKGYEEGVSDEEYFNDLVSTIEEYIEFLKEDSSDCESWKNHDMIFDEFYKLAIECEEYAEKMDSMDFDSMSAEEVVETLNGTVEYMENKVEEMEAMKEEVSLISVNDYQKNIDSTVEEMEYAIESFSTAIESLNETLEMF